MPAISRWSRSSECSRRESDARIRATSSTSSSFASGPRCASSACAASGRRSQTPARFFAPGLGQLQLAAVDEPQPEDRRLRALAALRHVLQPARRSSGGRAARARRRRSAAGSASRGARRRAVPRPRAPFSGGSNVFSVAMCAGPACSIGDRFTSGSSWRRHASTSGSSGTSVVSGVGGRDQGNRAARRCRRGGAPRARALDCGRCVRRRRRTASSARRSSRCRRSRSLEGYDDLGDDELAIACALPPGRARAARGGAEAAGARRGDRRRPRERPAGRAPGREARPQLLGKHAGMLAACRAHGWPLHPYRALEHPLQQRVAALVGDAEVAVDG